MCPTVGHFPAVKLPPLFPSHRFTGTGCHYDENQKKNQSKAGLSEVKIMVSHRVFVCRADNRCQMKLAHTSVEVGDQKLLPALKNT